jgi:GxxExxY protein
MGASLALSGVMSPLIPDALTGAVITAAIEVHRGLGPGLLESVYEQCLAWELQARRIPFEQQVPVAVRYKDVSLSIGYRVDFLIDGALIVELKAVERTLPLHHAQVITYLRLLGLHRALLINFNVPRLVDGLKSFLNGAPPGGPTT